MDVDAERAVEPDTGLTKIEPATFRGTDCTVLAERYAAYLRSKQRVEFEENLDVIRPSFAPASDNV